MTGPRLHLEAINPAPLKRLAGYLSSLVEKRLWLQVLIGLFAGILVGALLGPLGILEPGLASLVGNWLALPGMLFLAAVQMIVVPLVFASIILGLAASESSEQLRRMGITVAAYFLVTTLAAVALGLFLADIVEPGRALSLEFASEAVEVETPSDTPAIDLSELPARLIGLLPGNPLGSMVQGEMLQIVILSIIVGIALVALSPRQSRPLLDLLNVVQQVCMTIVRWAMWLAPFAVFGLSVRLVVQTGLEALFGTVLYVVTVLTGLLLLLVLYLVLVWILGRESPFGFLRQTRELLLLAFSTSSSAAVMPLSIKTAEEKLAVRPSIAQFVVPLGATINMNGTALYQGVAAMFLAQVYGVEISMSGMALIVAMAVGASIGSPATPGVGIVILAMVLGTVGIPAEGIALLVGVDRILDMSRTAINVAGDIVASKLMDRWIGAEAASVGRASDSLESPPA